MHFKIHNGARDVETRVQRAQAPRHGGLKQFIMNGSRRLLRGRPVVVTEDQLKQHLEELAAKEAQGILYVTSMDERELVPLAVALKHLKAAAEGGEKIEDTSPETKPEEKPGTELPTEPLAPVQNPTPNMPLDDASRDVPRGLPMNQNPNEAPPPAEFSMPVPAPHAAVETPAEAPLVDANAGPPAPPVEEPAAEPPAEEPAAEGSDDETKPASPGGKKGKKGR